MNVSFLSGFSKDLDKIRMAQVKDSVYSMILLLEQADSLTDIPNLKKLKGHKSAYRIKIGDYRIGLFAEELNYRAGSTRASPGHL